MNPVIKAKWVAALRSGNFQQGTAGGLRMIVDGRTEHCCLGVLCELAKEDGVVTAKKSGGSGSVTLFYDPTDPDDVGSSGYLPEVVVRWAGLPNRDPAVLWHDTDGRGDRWYRTLASINDSGEVPFPQIADLIKAAL